MSVIRRAQALTDTEIPATVILADELREYPTT